MKQSKGVLIIGAGQAAAAAAAKLRALGYQEPITMIGEEPSAPYQRPPLSKAYLLGQMSQERLWLRASSFWADNNINLILDKKISNIDNLSDFDYEHLVLATGATPRQLSSDLRGIYTLRNLHDVDTIRDEFQPERRLTIIGGGYIGLEAAAVGAKLGLKVTLIEQAPRILGRVAAAETADHIRKLHQSHGVEIIENEQIASIVGQSRVEAVHLQSGRVVATDFVIAGIGVTPNTELAQSLGLTIENGIATNAYGQTSQANVWAAGDCASLPWQGQQIRIESVGNAIDQAELVAANIMGAAKAYQPKPWFWSDQYDLKLQIAGLNTGYDRVVTRDIGGLSFWYYQGPRLLAVDAMSDPRAYMVGKRLIEAGKPPTPEAVASEPDLKVLLQ